MPSPTPDRLSRPARPAPRAGLIGSIWPWLAAPGSGVLLILCFAPWQQQWLCWFALTPLLAALWFGSPAATAAAAAPPVRRNLAWRVRRGLAVMLRPPAARGFFLGYTAGLVFFWGAFYWLWEVTPPGWFILSFYMALYFAIWGAFVTGVGRPAAGQFLRSRWNLWFAFLLAACWVGQEWVRGWMFSGFGWNDLGVGLHGSVPLIQIAEWTGVGGVSFMAAFANVIAVSTVYRFLQEVRIHKVRPHFDFTLTIAGVLAVFAVGFNRIQAIDREMVRPGVSVPLRVAAVQADIPRIFQFTPELSARIFRTYTQLTATALANRPQLLLWPESSTVLGMLADRNTFRFVKDTAAQAPDTDFILGTLDHDFGPEGTFEAEYNAAVLLPAGGEEANAQIYRKIHLVPFGEYIPFRKSFPLFAWIIGDQVPGDFDAGAEPGVFQLRSAPVKVAPLICFEDTLGRLVRIPVQRGAQLLVNITNDVWFGRTGQPQQHLDESVFRAVENRRPLARCANTGVTAYVDTTGRVTNSLRAPGGSAFTTGVLWGEIKVPAQPGQTFYTRNGEVFSIACALAAGLAALLHVVRSRRAVADPSEAGR